jgi:integrase
VFTWENGAALHPDLVTKTFKRLAKAAGLRPIVVYGLRHSYASAALEAGVDTKIVSGRVGHSSVAITSDLYQHVRREVDQQAADQVAAPILGAGS